MNVSIKLLSRIFKIFKILKYKEQKILFSKNEIFVEFTITRNMCERTLSGVYVYIISSKYIEKWPNSGALKFEMGHYSRSFLRFLYFPDFHNFPDLGSSKCYRVIFRVLDEILTQKHASRHPNPKFSVWPFLDLVTLNDLDLQYVHRILRMIFRSVPDTIHVVALTFSISYGSSER